MIFQSIKWRLQIWYGLSLVLVLLGFGFTAFQLERARTLRKIDGELQRRADLLLRTLQRPPREGRPAPRFRPEELLDRQPDGPLRDTKLPPEVLAQFDDADTNGFYYVLFRRDGAELLRSANAPAEARPIQTFPDWSKNDPTPKIDQDPRPSPDNSPPPIPEGNSPRAYRISDRLRQEPLAYMVGTRREFELTTPPGERVVVGRNIAPELREFRLTAARLALVGSGIVMLGLAVGWWLANRALRPIAAISHAAQNIAAGDLAQRIAATETESELGQLASVLNSTFARLEAAFAQQQQFTSDAAHELRTPVSVILSQTQSTLNKERTPTEYRETLAACQRSAERMRRLIESLLELARLDAGQEQLNRAPFDLANVARDCVELIRPLAAQRQLQLDLAITTALTTGDAERIAQVVTNLIANAVSYNNLGGQIRVATRMELGLAVLTVTDTGVGIAEEHLPHIFKRFYRVDDARSSANGHTGLGLAICAAIVNAHGGTLEAKSKFGSGSTFTLSLPAA